VLFRSERSHEFEHEITRGCEGIKPGWTRVSFNYFISEAVFGYLVAAVDMVATHGWKLLPEYRFDPQTGLWRHRRGAIEPPLRLSMVSYDPATGEMLRPPVDRARAPESALAGYLADAAAVFTAAQEWTGEGDATAAHEFVSAEFEHLRWFELPTASLE
jgi:hypothetical protein